MSVLLPRRLTFIAAKAMSCSYLEGAFIKMTLCRHHRYATSSSDCLPTKLEVISFIIFLISANLPNCPIETFLAVFKRKF